MTHARGEGRTQRAYFDDFVNDRLSVRQGESVVRYE